LDHVLKTTDPEKGGFYSHEKAHKRHFYTENFSAYQNQKSNIVTPFWGAKFRSKRKMKDLKKNGKK
jgi:hypothetical protein